MLTTYRALPLADAVRIEVTSDLAGTVYYHWYLDGAWVGSTTEPWKLFRPASGEQLRVEVLDTTDPDFDPLASAPAGYPATRTLWWVRSLDTDVLYYRVDQQLSAGDWEEVAQVHAEPGRWDYQWRTGRLDDLSEHAWRIVPLDAAGNDGTPITIGPERIVRRPDAPAFTLVYDAGPNRVTFNEAAA
jgi:hypothetical protein